MFEEALSPVKRTVCCCNRTPTGASISHDHLAPPTYTLQALQINDSRVDYVLMQKCKDEVEVSTITTAAGLNNNVHQSDIV